MHREDMALFELSRQKENCALLKSPVGRRLDMAMDDQVLLATQAATVKSSSVPLRNISTLF